MIHGLGGRGVGAGGAVQVEILVNKYPKRAAADFAKILGEIRFENHSLEAVRI